MGGIDVRDESWDDCSDHKAVTAELYAVRHDTDRVSTARRKRADLIEIACATYPAIIAKIRTGS